MLGHPPASALSAIASEQANLALRLAKHSLERNGAGGNGVWEARQPFLLRVLSVSRINTVRLQDSGVRSEWVGQCTFLLLLSCILALAVPLVLYIARTGMSRSAPRAALHAKPVAKCFWQNITELSGAV